MYKYYPNTSYYRKSRIILSHTLRESIIKHDLLPASDKQIHFLKCLGYTPENNISKRAAKHKIQELLSFRDREADSERRPAVRATT